LADALAGLRGPLTPEARFAFDLAVFSGIARPFSLDVFQVAPFVLEQLHITQQASTTVFENINLLL
jgi:hypothetical protein